MRRQRWMMLPMVMLAGAGLAVAPSAPAVAVTAAPAAVTCPTGWGSLPEAGPAGPARPLTDVRTGAHPCFDRMVLDVPGTSSAHPVGYHVRYVDKIVQDGSGKVLPIRGGAVIEVVATAPAYDPATGAQTYSGQSGRPLPGVDLNGYRTFVDARFASSFEGQSQIGLGVRARLPFRVFQLDNRLVIDVAHSWSATR